MTTLNHTDYPLDPYNPIHPLWLCITNSANPKIDEMMENETGNKLITIKFDNKDCIDFKSKTKAAQALGYTGKTPVSSLNCAIKKGEILPNGNIRFKTNKGVFEWVDGDPEMCLNKPKRTESRGCKGAPITITWIDGHKVDYESRSIAAAAIGYKRATVVGNVMSRNIKNGKTLPNGDVLFKTRVSEFIVSRDSLSNAEKEIHKLK